MSIHTSREGFLEDALKCPSCPDGFSDSYHSFMEYQNLALDTLRAFHNACEKHGIPYVLSDGSLIGAVRNNGVIPWDYDIDVLVPLEHRESLIQALTSELGDTYYMRCPEVDATCRHYIMRVCPVGYRSEELHVDVFYYTGAPDDEETRKAWSRRYVELVDHRYSRLVNIREASYGHPRRFLKLLAKKMLSLSVNLAKEYEEYSTMGSQLSYLDATYVIRCDQYGWDRRFNVGHYRTIYAEDLNNAMLFETNDGIFRIPVGYNRYLTEIYGDYMCEPPIENCIIEVMNSLEHLKHSKIH